MAAAAVHTNGHVPAPDLNGPHLVTSGNYDDKYAEEKNKRVGKGLAQYVDLAKSESFRSLLEDPWTASGTPVRQVVEDGGRCKFLIIGAGFGGVLFAVNLIKAGFSVEDLVIVDSAGGFGGTWYWNRYPGLMCDVESYIYCPMLEDMDYMPEEKYASGHELRLYCESICEKYGLHPRAMFQSQCDTMSWSADRNEYDIRVSQRPKGGEEKQIQFTAEFVILAGGILHKAKVPDLEGTDAFQGEMFHTSRWDYEVTGGSPADPTLDRLHNKRVGIVGTGATAIQVVPQVAKWAKELVVFQRTPSSVDARNNRRTDASTWRKEVATHPGWQKERNENYVAFVGNADEKPKVDLVNDGWTHMPSYSALIGGPSYKVTGENVSDHVARMNALDYPRQERVRHRAQKIVQDPTTAKSLQAWYAGWCKRPCFHDEYLPAFNRPNVKLVDTNGKGVDRLTPTGVQFDGKEYPLDVLVWSTGYLPPGVGTPASRADIHLTGRDGKTLDEKYSDGTATLHGVLSRGFPNLFWPGPLQTGAGPNFMFSLEQLSFHAVQIISQATKKAGGRVVIEPTAEAEQEWTAQCLAGAATFASVAGCTPSYLNAEGEGASLPVEQQIKAAKSSPWSRGLVDYLRVLEAWRKEGNLQGLETVAVS